MEFIIETTEAPESIILEEFEDSPSSAIS